MQDYPEQLSRELKLLHKHLFFQQREGGEQEGVQRAVHPPTSEEIKTTAAFTQQEKREELPNTPASFHVPLIERAGCICNHYILMHPFPF